MIRGLYTAGTAMLSQMKKMDVITNNLSNINTNGFKEDNLLSRSFNELLIERIHDDPSVIYKTRDVGPLGTGIHIDQVFTNFASGAPVETGCMTDLSITGEGFFVISIPDGERYTRDGAFQIDGAGRLTTKAGNPVMGENGEIYLGNSEFNVNSNGEIYVDGSFIDKLRILNFGNDDLRKEGNNLYMNFNPQNQGTASDSFVSQGFLEGSNVDPVKGMVKMIEVYRNYESNQKIIKMLDETLGKAVNEIGRL